MGEQSVFPRARDPPPRTVTHVRRRGPLVHACLQCTHTPPLPLTRPSAGTVRCPQGQGFHSSFPRLSLLPYRGQPPKLLAFQETSSGAFIYQLPQPREARRQHGYAYIGERGSVWVFPEEYTRLRRDCRHGVLQAAVHSFFSISRTLTECGVRLLK